MSIYIKKGQESLKIRIPVKKNPYLIIPILILVSLWVPFLLLLVRKSLINNDFITHLFNFNLGVELGQIIFVGLVLLIFWVFHRIKGFDFLVKEKLIPYMIGSLGVFWFLDRMSNIFSL